MTAIVERGVPSAKVAELIVPCANIEVVTFNWPYPATAEIVSDRPMLSLWTGAAGYGAAGRFADEISPGADQVIGQVFFLPADRQLVSHGTGGPVKTVRCRFEPEYFKRTAAPADRLTGGQLVGGLDIRSASMRFLLRRLMEEALAPGFGSEAMAECLAGMLAVEWARETMGSELEPAGRTTLTQRQFRTIIDRLVEPDLDFPSIAELAELCGFGDRTLQFCRAFKKHTGQSLSEHLAEARIERAQHLLLKTDLSLKEIAYRLGFSSPANFSTAFKAAMRQPPGAFRRRLN